ncbi:ETX/MTX2 family pore-forming toxin [Bacillus paranthracis]|uniref:ETX/MTX2 family pore-forming toxin n=1 Tax=Bacillus paranthracis TaxID=2026186 RepID=UPI003D64971F
MANVKNIDVWLSQSPQAAFDVLFGVFGDGCNKVLQLYNDIMSGKITDTNDFGKNVSIKNLTATPNIPWDSVASAVPVIGFENTFDNVNGTADQTFQTPQFTETITQSITHSVTDGWDYKAGSSIQASGKVGIPFVADGSVTTTVEFSTTINQSSTESKTETKSQQITVPSQPVVVPKGKKLHVSILFAKVIIPNTTMTLSGQLDGTVYYEIQGGGTQSLYDFMNNVISTRCSNSYINVDEFIQLNGTDKTIDLKGIASLEAELMSYQFYVKHDIMNANNEIEKTTYTPIHPNHLIRC